MHGCKSAFYEEAAAGLPAAILGRLLDERIITEEDVEVLALRATGRERLDAVPPPRQERDPAHLHLRNRR